MSPNPNKRRCEVAGCRAWAMRGEGLCRAHLRSRAVRARAELILPLLRLVATTRAGPLHELPLIDHELRQLLSAREVFLRWVSQPDESADKRARPLSPAQFMHAWNDSTTRLVQLLRARRALVGCQEGELGALLDAVYDELEKKYVER